ncbi:hypothetical protein [Algisphaera agarilytica]|uniref:Uncharacterized protein n=1 Tax=Algisphaera agarilytica TaxID=1385975 RepID=A0A7X0H7S2_9BACT|nr:hypothetical protein [Algisphaera agarilytica]MBB6430678.1 hypothetical protein [Algisphaera agarilytica]
MLPSQTQRVLMLFAVIIGTVAWWWLGGFLPPSDGLHGWSLFDASTGKAPAVGLLLLTALPALLAASFVAVSGNPISGVFCVALAGTIAHHGNGFAGVARRAADSGGQSALFPQLAVELILGIALLALLLLGLQAARRLWVQRVPLRLRSRHLGEQLDLLKLDQKSLTAGLVTAAIGAVLSAGLLRNEDPQQVAGGLVLAFSLAALIGHAVSPNHRPFASLIAPAVVGIVGYAWAWQSLRGTAENDALLGALYGNELPGLAMGLPLHYLTAGVLGCTIGIGIGQLVEKAKLAEG